MAGSPLCAAPGGLLKRTSTSARPRFGAYTSNRPRGDYDVTMFVPRIVYAYEADGHSFQSDDIGWSTSANRRSVAEKQVKRYPLQSQVRVYYNPDDPAQATLAPSVGRLALLLWFIAGAVAFAAFAVGWLIQFIGHWYEGRKPAFVDDLIGLLVGPMFVTAEALFSFGWGKELLAEIEKRAGPTVLRDLARIA